MTRLHRTLGVVVAGFMFFPYVGFVPGFDIQPGFVGIFLAALVLTAGTSEVSLKRVDLYVILVLYFSLFSRLMIQFIDGAVNEGWATSFMITGFHTTVFVLCLMAIRLRIVAESSRSLLTILSIYALVGIVQLFDESFLSFLVYRGYQELGSTGRGVRSLVSEPAVFGHTLIVLNLYFAFVALVLERRKIFHVCLITGVLVLLNALLARSAYSLFFHFAFFVNLLFCGYRIMTVLLIAISAPLFFSFLNAGPELFGNTDIRLLYILQTALDNPAQLYEQGAFLRVMNIPISLQGALGYGVFGSGFAPSETVRGSLIVFGNSAYLYEVSDRNMGGSVEFILRLGILSIPFFLVFLWGLITSWKNLSVALNILPRFRILNVFWVCFLTFSYSSPGNPVLWLLFWSVVINSRRIAIKREAYAHTNELKDVTVTSRMIT